jgi:predicted site-specific integrase-resolvase|tara:strand:+ start:669 stop:875 length:207 start_codon:yes stop_codon:yes gene_type:complete
MANQQLYTVREACDALFGEGYTEASRKRLRRWIEKGRVEAIADGQRYFIPRCQILKLGGSDDTEKTVE